MKNLRDKFKAQREKLVSRHQEQVESANEKQDFPSIFDKTKIPNGIEFWKPGKGDHIIDIIPFFAGPNHPRVSEGEVAYVVDLYVHNMIGPRREPFVCQMKNFRKDDPICEYVARTRLPTEEWKRFAPKRRTVYLVWVHDTPEEEAKGLQIWEVSHFFFEAHVDEIAKSPRGGGAIVFSDVDHGKSIAFSIKSSGKFKDASGVERDSIAFVGHRFVDRDEPIPDHILEQSFPLDSCIKMHPSYEEVEEALNYMINAPINPKKSIASKLKSEDEDEEDSFESDVENLIKTKSQKVSDDEDDDEDEDMNDDTDSDDDSSECPHNKFGVGFDKLDDCTFCDLYDACSDEASKLKKKSPTKTLKRK